MNDIILEVICKYEKLLIPYGFDIKPFLIGWYNDKLNANFRLNFPHDTLAINIINTPIMFKKTFLRFVKESDMTSLENKQDLLDESIDAVLNQVNNDISKSFFEKHKTLLKTVIMRDHEMNNITRQPKVAVRTSGHVSGQARYYQRIDIPADADPWPKTDKIFGCSIHHIYGGWFAFRGVIIFPEFKLPTLPYCEPPDPLQGNIDRIIDLLNEFNFKWKTWKFRDIIDVNERYCRAFMTYLSLPPGEQRLDLVKQWRMVLSSQTDDIDDICVNGDMLLDWGMG